MALEIIRPFAEEQYANEIQALIQQDHLPKPRNWKLSPAAVLVYMTGGKLADGTVISTKYYGSRRTLELAIATLLSDRALLLTGIPGTAKTWVAEHLTAAVSGDSSLLIQGTTGISEDQLRYGWNYAALLAGGPSEQALVPSPVMRAMESGQIVRLEELTRIPTEIQDALITVLSEKTLPIPELNRRYMLYRVSISLRRRMIRTKGSMRCRRRLKEGLISWSCHCPLRWKKKYR